MATNLEKKQLDFAKARTNQQLELFNQMIKAEESDDENDKMNRKRILEMIDKMLHEDEIHTNKLLQDKRDHILPRNLFPAPNEVLAENENIKLIAFSSDHKEWYFDMQESEEKIITDRDQIKRDVLFSACISDVSLYYIICSKSDDKYMGFVAIRNISNLVWELSIKLSEEYRYQGIGEETLRLFLDSISEISGETVFKCMIFSDNYASQSLFKKIGAVPKGISERIIYGTDTEKFEQDNRKLIDDNMINLAREFQAEPKHLLSHVLEYVIEWPGK